MSQSDLTIVVKDDPFSDRPPRLIRAPHGTPISELVSLAGFEELEIEHTEASIDGQVIPMELWAETPATGHTHLVQLPQGGDDGNKILRTVLTLAVIVSAFYLGGPIASALGLTFNGAAGVVTAVLTTIGQLAINAILPPPQFESGDAPEPVYFIEGARNRLNPLAPLNTVLGSHRIVPQLAARPYPEIRGDDTYYYIVLDLGPIGLEVEDIKVGDTPIANFDEVVIQSRLVASDPQPNMSSRSVIPQTVGATLLDGDPEVRRTASGSIDCDLIFAFPQGLGRTSDQGKPQSNTLTVQVRYREVINPGPSETFGDWRFASSRTNVAYPDFRGFENIDTLSGGGIGGNPNFGTSATFTFRESKPAQPFFRQVGFSFPSEGTYEVEVMRTSADSTEAGVFDDVTWQTILSKRDEPIILRDDVATMHFRFKGTDETSGIVDEINMVAHRLVPRFPDAVLDQPDLSGVTEADLTLTDRSSNPWEIELWAMRNGFEGRVATQDSAFDWPAAAAAVKDARDRGLKFDYFVQRDVNIDTLGSLIASTGGEGRVYNYNGKWTFGLDRPQAAPSHVFRDGVVRNVSSVKTFAEEVHGYRVQFNDAGNGWRTREEIIYVDGFTSATATKIQPLPVPGKTDWDDIHRHVFQLHRNAVLQNTTMTLEVPARTIDNTLRPLSWVAVATSVITQVQGSGVIRGVTAAGGNVTEIEIDQEVELGPSFPGLAIKWILVDSEGNQTQSLPAPISQPVADEKTDTITLTSPVPELDGPAARLDYIIGPIGTDVFDGLLEKAEKAGNGWLRLTLKAYAVARFDETGNFVPAYAVQPVLPLGSGPPEPVFQSAEASNFKVTVNFSMPDGYEQDLREIRVWRANAPPDTDPNPNTYSVFEQLPSLAADVRQLVDGPGDVGDRLVYRFQVVATSGRVSTIMQTPIITVADILPAATNFAAVGATELGSNGVVNPVIRVTWDPEVDASVQEAVIEARIVAKDAGDVRLPEGSQPAYTPVTNIPAVKGTYTIRGVPPGVDMDVIMFYRGRRGEIGTTYEVQDVAVPDGNPGTTGPVDWGNIIGRPLELTDGRVAAGLDVFGNLAQPIPQALANSSNLLRYTNGALFTGSLDADRTLLNIAAGVQNQGALATEDFTSDRVYANFITQVSGIAYSNSEFDVEATDLVCGVDNIYREKAFATITCDGSPVEILFTAFFGEGAPNTSSEGPELSVSALIRRVEGAAIISQGSKIAVLRGDGVTTTGRVFGGTYRVHDPNPGGTPASPVNRTYQIFLATTGTSPKPPADTVAFVNPNVWSGMRLTVHRANANNIT